MKTSSILHSFVSPDILAGPKRLLIIRLRNLGDCILATPAFHALKQWNSSLHITVLVESRFAAVYHGNPHIDHLEILPGKGTGMTRLLERWRCAQRLRQGRYDCAWNLHGGSTSLYFTLASRSRSRIGFAHYRRSKAYTHLVPPSTAIWNHTPVHTVENQLAPLKWLGIINRADLFSPQVFISAPAEKSIDRFLHQSGVKEQPFILMQPTATLRTKQWPEERFGQLILGLNKNPGLKTILSVGPGEMATAKRVLQYGPKETPVFQGKNLEELKALLQRCAFYIGNDSGPMHLAAALKRPVLAIFSSSHLHAWHPWNTLYEAVRYPMDCSPCPGYRCYEFETPRCVQNLSVEEVCQAFHRLTERVSSAGPSLPSGG